MKKKICLFLMIVFVLAALPAAALAEESPSSSSESGIKTEEATETPSESPLPTETPEPQSTSLLSIDNARVYAGMDKPYSQGYIPSVQGGTAAVVLPLIASGGIQGDQINSTVNLGDPSTSPFVFGNYDQTIPLQDNPVDNGSTTVPSYLVSLSLPMDAGRVNGRYPVTVNTSYVNTDGMDCSQSFTVYVTVTDGKDPNATPAPEPTPTPEPTEAPRPQPKIIVNSHTVAPADVIAGGTFDLTVTLRNTSESQSVRNLTVTAKGDTTDLIPAGDTGTEYISKISSGSTADFDVEIQVRPDAKPGPHKVLLSIAYENSEATAFTAEEEIIVQVKQPIRLEYDDPAIPESINAGDTISVSLNLMNMGKSTLYNVRFELQAPGLIPEGSAFIGNMESGTSQAGDVYVFVGTLDMTDSPGIDSDSQYGPTQGSIAIICEDEYGEEYTQQIDFSTVINPPVIQAAATDEEEMEEPETVSQWWISVIVAGGIAAALAAYLYIRRKKRRLLEDEAEDEYEDE